jgi:hypothetical protein
MLIILLQQVYCVIVYLYILSIWPPMMNATSNVCCAWCEVLKSLIFIVHIHTCHIIYILLLLPFGFHIVYILSILYSSVASLLTMEWQPRHNSQTHNYYFRTRTPLQILSFSWLLCSRADPLVLLRQWHQHCCSETLYVILEQRSSSRKVKHIIWCDISWHTYTYYECWRGNDNMHIQCIDVAQRSYSISNKNLIICTYCCCCSE